MVSPHEPDSEFLRKAGIGIWKISVLAWPLVLPLCLFLIGSCSIRRGASSCRTRSDASVIGFRERLLSFPAGAVLDLANLSGTDGDEDVVVMLGWRFNVSIGTALEIGRLSEFPRAAMDVSPRFGPLLRSEDFRRPVLEPGIRVTFVSVIQKWLPEYSFGLRSSTVYAWSILTLSLLRQHKTIMIEPITNIMIVAPAAVPHITLFLTPDAMAGQADLRPRLNFNLHNTYRARKAWTSAP